MQSIAANDSTASGIAAATDGDAPLHVSGGGPTGEQLALPSLDLGRFFAAAVVMLFHYGFLIAHFKGDNALSLATRAGHAGVNYFFVLSGFIILYIHRRDVSCPTRIPIFALKRTIRIVPMLWITIVAWGVLRMILADETTQGEVIGVRTLLLDMFLIPHAPPMVLPLVWTLTREAVFYVLFAVALLDRRVGFATLLCWQITTIAVGILGPAPTPWFNALFGIENIGFGIGMLIALAPPLRRRSQAVGLALTGVAALVLLLVLETRIGGPYLGDYAPLGNRVGPVLYSAAAGLMLYGLASFDRIVVRPESMLIRYLGGCSYALYLIHGPVGSLAIRVLGRFPLPLWLLLALLSAVGVGAAILVHVLFEQPVLRHLRRATSRPPSREIAA